MTRISKEEFQAHASLFETHVRNLGLKTYTHNSLISSGRDYGAITTLAELIQQTEVDLRARPYIGTTTIKDIRTALANKSAESGLKLELGSTIERVPESKALLALNLNSVEPNNGALLEELSFLFKKVGKELTSGPVPEDVRREMVTAFRSARIKNEPAHE